MLKIYIVLALAFAVSPLVIRASDQTERGKYLVEEVGKCQDCHTPRLPDGQFDRTKWLKGSVLGFQPIEPIKEWHKTAPDLTPSGRLWLRWKEKGLVEFFKTGLGPGGHRPDPPMPAYTLKSEDAEAIVAYLKTLQ